MSTSRPQRPQGPALAREIIDALRAFTTEMDRYIATRGGAAGLHRTDLNALAHVLDARRSGGEMSPGELAHALGVCLLVRPRQGDGDGRGQQQSQRDDARPPAQRVVRHRHPRPGGGPRQLGHARHDRIHNEACVGCMVESAAVSRSDPTASRSTSWRSRVANASTVTSASYLLR